MYTNMRMKRSFSTAVMTALILSTRITTLWAQNATLSENSNNTLTSQKNCDTGGLDGCTVSTILSDSDNSTAVSTNESLTDGDKELDPVPQPTVSKELYDRMMAAIDTFSLYFELVSVILTTISAYIYALPSMRCATAYYLVGLNSADTLSGTIVVIRNVWQAVDKPAATSSAGFHYMTVFGSLFITVACRRMVYCFFLILSAERFFVIAWPLKARYMKIIRYPRLCILVLVFSIQTYHVYLPLKYKVAPSRRGQGYAMVYSDLFQANEQVFDDVSNASKIMFSYLPLAGCLVLSIALRTAIQRHAACRQDLQESQEDAKTHSGRSAETQMARTIWLSTLLFALLSFPGNTIQVVSSYHDTFRFLGFEHRLHRLVGRFGYIALISSRYTNFLAYLGLSTSFRRNLIRLLLPLKVVKRLEEKKEEEGPSGDSGVTAKTVSTTQVSTISFTEQ